jgi:hypothetical protein
MCIRSAYMLFLLPVDVYKHAQVWLDAGMCDYSEKAKGRELGHKYVGRAEAGGRIDYEGAAAWAHVYSLSRVFTVEGKIIVSNRFIHIRRLFAFHVAHVRSCMTTQLRCTYVTA